MDAAIKRSSGKRIKRGDIVSVAICIILMSANMLRISKQWPIKRSRICGIG
jgi:hypothetical protein